jgi:hypothetical protein
VNGWKYWGIVFQKNKTYKDRFIEHMDGKGGNHLYKGVLKYGRDAFSIDLIEEGSIDYIRQREVVESIHTQYKQHCGWNGNVGKAIHNSLETIEIIKQKKSLKQKETSQKVSDTQRGFSLEKKQNIQTKRNATIANKTPEEISLWRISIVSGWKGKTKEECEKLQKNSKSMIERCKQPTEKMLLGRKKQSLTKTGRTKETHEGTRRQSEKMKGQLTGEKNPSFKGWWITPFGRFPSIIAAGKSVGYKNPQNVKKLCIRNVKIDKRILNSTNLDKKFFKCWSLDIGFGFIPKS